MTSIGNGDWGERAALDDPATQAALRDYGKRGWRTLLIGLLGFALMVAVIELGGGHPSGFAETLAIVFLSFGAVTATMGTVALMRSVRIRSVLRQHPWVLRDASYRIAPLGENGQPALLLRADDRHGETVYSMATTARRYQKLPQGDNPFLVVGFDRWAVVAPADRSILVVAKRPLIRWWRRKLRKYATTPDEP